ncbi:MAG TPA: TetR/AcrR family transcriptional regulator C-terminal domain-containing protein [Devosia sp.]|uniref:TetR/AcrR family transcriptional regulator n=1 Tax=Devosia sp. TaxID=1871048 RepID=UPI002DDD2003|nr:TetR/AcrR family transcriptional regulator C-terminal domain-containing protein [Devosia sp.]HEV2515004.1 TetR/AcrR family transcriptional regulator C-terminal domain-containing protein [Devosia sp.]
MRIINPEAALAGNDTESSLVDTIALLWSDHSRQVGRSGHTIGDFVAAATELVQAEGLAALSMRAVATRLGVRTMATYSFAPGKAALLALMVDRAYRNLYAVDAQPRGQSWQQKLTQIAEANYRLLLANPWLHAARPARSPMGPHEIAKTEIELAALEGIGLADIEMDQALAAVLNHAAHAAALQSGLLAEREQTGLGDPDWWREAMPQLERFVDPHRFPLTARVGQAATAARQGEFWGEKAFRFGLERLLDGIETLIAGRRG